MENKKIMDAQPKYTFFILALFSIIFCKASLAQNWESLFNKAQYSNVKISPDGNHLAISLDNKGKTVLAFFNRKTMVMVGTAALGGRNEVGDFYWVNNERVVFKLVQSQISLDEPVYFGELFAVNLTGKSSKLIYGYRSGEKQIGTKVKKKKSIRGWAEIIDILPEDEKHILISSTYMNKSGEGFPEAMLLNVYTGVIKRELMRSPVLNGSFITDYNGKIRAVSGLDKDNSSLLFIRTNNDWVKVPKQSVGGKVHPIAIDSTGGFLYTIDNFNQDRLGLFKLKLDDFSYKNVFTDQNVDITNISLTTNGRSVYGLRLDDGYPEYVLLNNKLDESKVFKTLLASFPYNSIRITSRSSDGNFYVVSVTADTNPGSLYLFDKSKNKLKLLFKYHPELSTDKLKEMEPIKVTSSDGTIINGYFTNAKANNDNSPAPLVILIHGGPHYVRDYWGYSNYVQYLALNGFSVLQVNYRGSDGYGTQFARAGFKHWGTTIQQDIYDSYQWLIQQNKASKDNACIMGGSFGAYSAIQSSIMFPNTYKCAVANAGIYDLPLMFEEGDIRHSRTGRFYLKDTLGTDKGIQKAMSPVYNINKLSTPVLLAHGKADDRAPFEHATRLRTALEKEDKYYEWYAVEKEGHGFYNAKNQQKYMEKVLTFLQQHLK